MDPLGWKKVEALWERKIACPGEDVHQFLAEQTDVSQAVAEQFLKLWQEAETGNTEKWIQSASSTSLKAIESAVDEEVIGRSFGGYTVIDRLGHGGSATVYRARKIEGEMSHLAAIKVFPREEVADDPGNRFEFELRALAQLTHPFITQYIGSGTTEDGLPYLITELVQGSMVTQVADRFSNGEKILRLFQQICTAVDYAHRSLLIHCDLKPSNILVVDDTQTPKVLDFGLAQQLRKQEGIRSTNTSAAFSRNYASPEMLDQRAGLTTATDVYSLGVLLHRLITGDNPYDLAGVDVAELSDHLRKFAPQPGRITHRAGLKGLGRGQTSDLGHIVCKAIAFQPAERYGSVSELADDLQRVLAERPVAAAPHSIQYVTRRFVVRHRWLAGFALAGIMALTVGGSFYAYQAHRTQIQSERFDAVNKILIDILSAPDPFVRGKDARVLDLLEVAADRLEKQPPDDRFVSLSIMQTLGRTFLMLGELERARELLTQARPEEHDEVPTDLKLDWEHWWIKLLIETGQYGDALERARQHYQIVRSGADQNPERLAEVTDLLALATLYGAEDFDKAAALAEEAAELFDRLDTEHSVARRSQALTVAGMALSMASRLDRAYELQMLAMTEAEERLGPNNPTVFYARNNLARTIEKRGDLNHAYQLLTENYALARHLFGEQASPTLMAANNLGVNAFRREDYAKAVELFSEVARLRAEALGAEHRRTLTAQTNLADALLLDGQLDAACERAGATYSVSSRAHSDSHFPGFALKVLGKCERERGEFDTARKHLEEVRRLFAAGLGPASLQYQSVTHDLAVLEARAGNISLALQYVEEEQAGLNDLVGTDHHRYERATSLIEYLERCRASGLAMCPEAR